MPRGLGNGSCEDTEPETWGKGWEFLFLKRCFGARGLGFKLLETTRKRAGFPAEERKKELVINRSEDGPHIRGDKYF